MNTIIFLLICYGACNNLIFGSVFEGWRNLLAKMGQGGYSIHKLFTCMMCLSTWMGFIISFGMIKLGLGVFLPIYITGVGLLPLVFMHGLLATGGVWLLHTLQEYFEK